MTQADLAGEEFTKSFISQIEKNQARPSLKSLQIFAQRLNRPVSYFLDDGPDTSPTPSQAQRRLPPAICWSARASMKKRCRLTSRRSECTHGLRHPRPGVPAPRLTVLVELDQLPRPFKRWSWPPKSFAWPATPRRGRRWTNCWATSKTGCETRRPRCSITNGRFAVRGGPGVAIGHGAVLTPCCGC